MKIIQINAVPYGSTGRIMFSLADTVENEGGKVICTSGFTWIRPERDDYFITSNILEKTIHTYMSRITGMTGCFSYGATKKLIKKIEEFKPDIVHLHNMHGWFVNLPMLFNYIKANDLKVVWTLHDCWSFTGQCPHYAMIGCDKWKTGCGECSQFKHYPQTYFDNSQKMYRLKKNWFTNVNNLTVVTPSEWMKKQVEESFLKKYPVKVINNGINLDMFCSKKSSFKEKYGISNKNIILGVSYEWNEKKGLDVFCRLADIVNEEYQIVLVGTNKDTDKILPKNIISIHRTQNIEELVDIYNAATVFVNPTREDTFPTVNIEALACGTPVVTFNTGGSPEIIDDSCGSVINDENIDELMLEIEKICTYNTYLPESCRLRAEMFDNKNFIKKYMDLYAEIINEQITEITV